MTEKYKDNKTYIEDEGIFEMRFENVFTFGKGN